MTPFDKAAVVYQSEPCAHSFHSDLIWYHENGFVFSTPNYFIMARPVDTEAHENDIVGRRIFKLSECDGWLIHCMAGDISRVWEIMPFYLPLLAFQRKNELRVMPFSAMRRLAEINKRD